MAFRLTWSFPETYMMTDLYGNDEETDFTVEPPLEEPQETASSEHNAVETSSTATTATVKSELADDTNSGFQNGSVHTTQTTSASAPIKTQTTSAIPTYSSTPSQPQKIPTYEQPPASAPRPDSGLQKIPVNERSVRPSEMKDEG